MLLDSPYRFGVIPPSEAAGNLLTSGNKNFSSGWNDVFGTGTTMTANATTDPLGASTAATFITASAAFGTQWQSRGVTFGKAASSIEYWASYYIKLHSGSLGGQFELSDTGGNNGCGMGINFTTGVSAGSGYSYGSQFTFTTGSPFSRQLTNGWWQIGMRVTIGSAHTNPLFAIYISSGGTANFVGDGTSGFRLWRPRIALIADGYL
jgi:hypothetical protein